MASMFIPFKHLTNNKFNYLTTKDITGNCRPHLQLPSWRTRRSGWVNNISLWRDFKGRQRWLIDRKATEPGPILTHTCIRACVQALSARQLPLGLGACVDCGRAVDASTHAFVVLSISSWALNFNLFINTIINVNWIVRHRGRGDGVTVIWRWRWCRYCRWRWWWWCWQCCWLIQR